ncbi:MAG TPA: enoyl-CoA hydratase/isomerase family protein [Acidimicrobiales bacterium]|nr:enoyl-CoA hydratase/isomerase family protein [Acidimicrobiales bacterium]
MTEDSAKDPMEEALVYDKDPSTKIATITFNRPEQLNAPTIGMRLRYARLLDLANVDDDVKVLVVRGAGEDFGSGADLPELAALMAEGPEASLREELSLDGEDVSYPLPRTFRATATLSQWYADPRSGCRTLQDFKKISIVEAKGYCYGWHFYQAADADLVIASEDALFGHPAFRYVGWGPRMWSWAMTMGIRKFQEMVFTGRPFSAQEMAECNFVNSVVPRADLEAEVAKYASACSKARPTDAVVMQKAFFQMMKQYQGEYMGSLLSAFLENMGGRVRPDQGDLMLDDDTYGGGLNKAVKVNDAQFPPEFRLSKTGRTQPD